jgi:hypothetical protein
MRPGHQAIVGTRMPPSVRLRLMPVSGPDGWKRAKLWLLSLCGPLSLVKITKVFSAKPSSSKWSSKRPT